MVSKQFYKVYNKVIIKLKLKSLLIKLMFTEIK